MFRRTAIYQFVFFAIVSAILIYFQQWVPLSIVVIMASLSIFLSWKKYKKTAYALNQDNLFIGGGILGFKNSICPIYKIQNLAIQQNYYQQRRDLATLRIHTAAGAMSIPYINITTAQQLMDRLISQVQQSKRSWM